jgi:hypothetical protein
MHRIIFVFQMLPLALLALGVRPHETPNGRISATRTVSPGSPLFEALSIDEGRILLLTITAPHAVLSIQNHGDFFLCFQLSAGGWFLADEQTFGFFSFGPSSQTVVEVVALKSAEFLVGCCFLDECPEVLAGNSLTYRATAAARTCFMATDLASKVAVAGGLQNGTMEIASRGVRSIYDPGSQIPGNFLPAQIFQIVKLSTYRPNDLELQFVEGNAAFRFGRVTNATGPGIVGVSGLFGFVPLSGEPPYPPLDPDPLAYALLGVVPVSIVLVCVGFTSVLSRTVKDGETGGSDNTASTLYDEQSADPEAADVEAEADKKAPSDQGSTADGENPYDNGGLCL